MIDKVDGWFLQIAVLVLSGYFMWSIRGILIDFKDQIKKLNETIETLFDKHGDHERRLSKIEGRCDYMHNGRRSDDP